MQIEAGKYYLTRDGQRVGPVRVWEGGAYEWAVDGENGKLGGFMSDDLIQVSSPVREVTHKEIVPGVYGPISVKEPHPRYERSANICIQPTYLSAYELRAAAVTLIELADALEPKP